MVYHTKAPPPQPSPRLSQEETASLFLQYKHKDYQLKILGIPQATMARYLSEGLLRSNGATTTLREQGHLRGLFHAVFHPWTSEQLGVRVWCLQHLLCHPDLPPKKRLALLRQGLGLLQGQADLLYLRAAASDVETLQCAEQEGFRMVGHELSGCVPTTAPTEPCALRLQPLQEHNIPHAKRIALQSHRHNHFAYDPHLPRDAVARLYANLLPRQVAQPHTHVYEAVDAEDTLQGFISVRRNTRLSEEMAQPMVSLDFIGVAPDTQGLGVGSHLNRHALQQAASWGAEQAAVRTMSSNYPALSALRRMDFRVTSSNVVFHHWLTPPTQTPGNEKVEALKREG